MKLQLRRPRRVPSADVALSRIRGLSAILAGAVCVFDPTAFEGRIPLPDRAVGGITVGLLLLVNGLAAWRQKTNPARIATCILLEVLLDLLVAIVLMVQAGAVAAPALILALPIVEAGLRFGTLGVFLGWAALTAAMATDLAIFWPTNQLSAAAKATTPSVISMLLISLPIAYLAEHLVGAVHRAEETNRHSDERASMLEILTSASPRMATFDRVEVLNQMADLASALGCAQPTIWQRTQAGLMPVVTRVEDQSVASLDLVEETAPVTIHRLEFGGESNQMYVLTYTDPVDVPDYRDEALEVLLLQARTALATAAVHTDLEQLQAESEHAAYTDALTGLPNRRALDLIETEGQFAGRCDWAVIYIDLDGFKNVNDRIGHHAGDEMLQRVAAYLNHLVAPNPVVRLGGDEFLIVLPDIDAAAAAMSVARIIHDSVNFESFGSAGQRVVVGASAGVGLPMPGESLDEVVHNADRAMYEAKRLGTRPDIRAGALR